MEFPNSPGGGARSYYLRKQTIVQALNVPPDEHGDVGVELVFPIVTPKKGEPFSPKLTVKGKFKRDAAGVVESIGTAFRVQRIWDRVGERMTLNSETGLTEEQLSLLVGKEIWTVQYRASKRDGGTFMMYWEQIADASRPDSEQWLEQEFLKTVNSAYPPYKYAPIEGTELVPGGQPSPQEGQATPF